MNPMSFSSEEDLLKWCDSNEAKVKNLLDGMMDKLDIKNRSVRSLLIKGSEILNGLDDLKKEVKEKN